MSDRSLTPHPGLTPRWLSHSRWQLGDSEVRALQPSDLAHLRRWRNDQQDVLRQQEPISEEHQQRWFDDVVSPSFRQTRPNALLVVVDAGTPQCYGGLTNIDWVSRRGEVSFLAPTETARDEPLYAETFLRFLEWLTAVSFGELGFHRIFTETWDFREHHIAVLERAGFRQEGRLADHVAKNGRIHDAVIHGLLTTDPKAVN